MTETPNAGESRGGEGRSEAPTTSLIARAIAQEYADDVARPDEIKITPITERLFAVEILYRGVAEPERRMVALSD